MHHSIIAQLQVIGSVLFTLLVMLLADVIVAFIAILFLLGDKLDGDYTAQYRILCIILAVYLAGSVGMAYRQYKRQRITRATGILLGVIPIVLLLGKFLRTAF